VLFHLFIFLVQITWIRNWKLRKEAGVVLQLLSRCLHERTRKIYENYVWDLRFSRRWGRWWCPGPWRRVDWSVDAICFEERYCLCIFRSEHVDLLGLTPCRLLYKRLIALRWRQYFSLKYWHLPTSLHGARTRNNNTMETDVRINSLLCQRRTSSPSSTVLDCYLLHRESF
jgi:hypothetical protein